jgi:hypothetical protein
MYTRQEVSLIKKKFWTSFGQYMRPIQGANGDTINWINYKTGVRNIYFRMDADINHASIAIELTQADSLMREQNYEQLQQLKKILEKSTGEEWNWQLNQEQDGNIISRVSKILPAVNILNENDWPAIISFLKPRIIALDNFWMVTKDGFD